MGSVKVWSGRSDDGLTVEAWTRPGVGDLELFVFDANPDDDGATGTLRVPIPGWVADYPPLAGAIFLIFCLDWMKVRHG